jgi:hypothetical protein
MMASACPLRDAASEPQPCVFPPFTYTRNRGRVHCSGVVRRSTSGLRIQLVSVTTLRCGATTSTEPLKKHQLSP